MIFLDHKSLLRIAANEIVAFCKTMDHVIWLFFECAKVGKGVGKGGGFLNEICSNLFLLLLYKTNRFHVAVRLFSNR